MTGTANPTPSWGAAALRHFVPGCIGPAGVLDHRTGELHDARRRPTSWSTCGSADGLPNIAYLATAFSSRADIATEVADAWRLHLCLTNSRKPRGVSGAFTEHGVPRMASMMELFRRDRADLIDPQGPMAIFTVTPTGGFRYGDDSCQNLLDCVEAGIPIGDRAGDADGSHRTRDARGHRWSSTRWTCSPGITMAQLIKPGAPVLWGCRTRRPSTCSWRPRP